jgi:hypothetical protein
MARGVKVEMMPKKVFTRISRSETRLKYLQAASLMNLIFDKKNPNFQGTDISRFKKTAIEERISI